MDIIISKGKLHFRDLAIGDFFLCGTKNVYCKVEYSHIVGSTDYFNTIAINENCEPYFFQDSDPIERYTGTITVE